MGYHGKEWDVKGKTLKKYKKLTIFKKTLIFQVVIFQEKCFFS
jgi:hypothetical protein